MTKAFFFDNSRCTGCRTCQLACKDYHDLSIDQTYRKVYDMESGACSMDERGVVTHTCKLYHVAIGCNHCEDPACTKVCPTGAMEKDPETGLVSVDGDKCLGCGYCVMACPYGAPTLDKTVGHTIKCDGCKNRVAEGKKPICVEACPLRALDFGEVEEMKAHGESHDIDPLPSSSYTKPSLYIRMSPDAKSSQAADSRIANPLEVF